MPEEITIDGLFVDDSNTPENYEGLYYFTDPDNFYEGVNEVRSVQERPYPYAPCRKLIVRGFETITGLMPRISAGAQIMAAVELENKS